jgi:hypothetical protein
MLIDIADEGCQVMPIVWLALRVNSCIGTVTGNVNQGCLFPNSLKERARTPGTIRTPA